METTNNDRIRFTPQLRAKIVDLALAGESKTYISNVIGCHKTTVTRILKKAGVAPYPTGRPRLPKEYTDAVVGLYNRGLSAKDVADYFGIEKAKVHDIIKSARKVDPKLCPYRNIPTPKKKRV